MKIQTDTLPEAAARSRSQCQIAKPLPDREAAARSRSRCRIAKPLPDREASAGSRSQCQIAKPPPDREAIARSRSHCQIAKPLPDPLDDFRGPRQAGRARRGLSPISPTAARFPVAAAANFAARWLPYRFPDVYGGCEPAAPGLGSGRAPISFKITMSTRRLCARPSSESLDSTGTVSA